MNIKLIAVIGAVLTTAAGMFYAVNKTARKLEEENDSLPESQRKTREELDESLDSEFRSRVAKNPICKVGVNLFNVIKGLVEEWMDYRVKVAIVGVILSVIPGLGVPMLAVRACWSVLAFELALRTVLKSIPGAQTETSAA